MRKIGWRTCSELAVLTLRAVFWNSTLERLVTAIKASAAWKRGRNAIVVVWDESDYSNAPITNRATLVVQTSDGENAGGVQSGRFYTHFSLLKSMEAAFGLPCLNHACDPGTAVMTDLFNTADR